MGPVMQIDFWEGNHRNIGISNIETAMLKLHSLTIFNDGPGPIQFSTNKARGSTNAGMVLNATENIKVDTPIVFGTHGYVPMIERLNICAPTTSGAFVRIMGVV